MITDKILKNLAQSNVIIELEHDVSNEIFYINAPTIKFNNSLMLYRDIDYCKILNNFFKINSINDVKKNYTIIKTIDISKQLTKHKIVKKINKDKYGNNLVLELFEESIYLSNALLSYLELNEFSKVNFARDDENNIDYLYEELEENEGYIIENNIINCPHIVTFMKSIFKNNILYLDIIYKEFAEEPSYKFYKITNVNVQNISESDNNISEPNIVKVIREPDIFNKNYSKNYSKYDNKSNLDYEMKVPDIN